MGTLHDSDSDEHHLRRLGYEQQLHRRMSGFANYALSLSIICILAGGVTSFAQGFCAVGGAAVGFGWPLWTVLALVVAATMGQVASAFPTAGGLYHWAAILGGRGWGWLTAWFNLAGLVAVLAAINRGTIDFATSFLGIKPSSEAIVAAVAVLTAAQGWLNHRGIRVTTLLTNFSGYWIVLISFLLTAAMLMAASSFQTERLWTFSNFGGDAGGGVLPPSDSLTWLFLIALLLPAYTLTGFDASAHAAEETVGARTGVPRGIVRSVLVSGFAGWAMLAAVVIAMPNVAEAAAQGNDSFAWTMKAVLPGWLAYVLFAGIVLAQCLCGLATVTSASRMAYAFARDGGLPASRTLAQVNPRLRSPVPAIWLVVSLAVLLTAFVPYATIAAVCAVLLYTSYVLPSALGAIAYGRTWTRMGPWDLGRWYRPLAVVAALACLALLIIGMEPPNQQARWIVGGMFGLLILVWFGYARRAFRGPPRQLLDHATAHSIPSERYPS